MINIEELAEIQRGVIDCPWTITFVEAIRIFEGYSIENTYKWFPDIAKQLSGTDRDKRMQLLLGWISE